MPDHCPPVPENTKTISDLFTTGSSERETELNASTSSAVVVATTLAR